METSEEQRITTNCCTIEQSQGSFSSRAKPEPPGHPRPSPPAAASHNTGGVTLPHAEITGTGHVPPADITVRETKLFDPDVGGPELGSGVSEPVKSAPLDNVA